MVTGHIQILPKKSLKVIMATLEQSKLQLLMFGYIRTNYNNDTPMEIKKLIQLFYDEYFRWKLQGDELQKFLNTNNGQMLVNKSTFTIKGFEFECGIYPNGRGKKSIGFVQFCISLKTMPSGIRQVIMFLELACNTFKSGTKNMIIWTNKLNPRIGVCKLSQCQDIKEIEFSCLVRILQISYIIYKNSYFARRIKMSKFVEYEWRIANKEQMERIRNWGFGECCDNFDNNNWTIRIKPTGFVHSPKYPGKLAISILCLAVPHGIKSMEVEYTIELLAGLEVIQKVENRNRLKFVETTRTSQVNNRLGMECPNVDVDELFTNNECVTIKVSIEILDIYDYTEKIGRDGWQFYGIL